MIHQIYIASTLDNAPRVRRLRDLLARYDVQLTYDWTSHNGGAPYVPDSQQQLKCAIAEREVIGVYRAEAILIVLPGGGGTHFEFGLGFCLKKPIVLLADEAGQRNPSFHYLGDVKRAASEAEAIALVLAYLRGSIKVGDHLIDKIMRGELC